MRFRFLVQLLATLALCSCGDRTQPAAPQTDPLFKSQRDALDQARAVSQIEAQHSEELQKEEERQTK